ATPSPPEAPPVVAEALERDLQRLAKSRGWTIEETRQRHAETKALNRVLARVAEDHPDIYVGGIAPASPGDDPVLLVKGKAGGDVHDLVAHEPATKIVVKDQQPFSLAELQDRQRRLHDSLTAMGYRNVASLADIERGGEIRANVGFENGMPSTHAEILPKLPESLREATAVSFMEPKAFRNEATWGGNILNGTANPHPLGRCTSGFTVRFGPWTRGFLTAGHCVWTWGVDHVATESGEIFDAPWVFGYLHIGGYGDWAVHQASTTHESQFRASPTEIRSVWDVEDGPIANNTTVSFYSRQEFDVFDVDVESGSFLCEIDGYPTVNRLTLMDNTEDISSGGDSGAAWFVGSTAYGVHKGRCPMTDPDQVAFTPIHTIKRYFEVLAPSAPSVEVTRWWEWW
ncbi:MAG: hypothetical protein OXU20_15585, partial [Myxococcales bacterium]|nr:hypothetical protein [Myxococcales bacterium]